MTGVQTCALPISNTWEVGLGTVTSGSPATLSRDTVLSNSSGTTAKINFANSVTAWCDYPAGKAVYKAADDSVSAPEFAASNGLLLNNATVGTSYSVPSGYNAVSAGPVSVASGVTVTLPSGSNWVVV